jgi:hypothetical protein
MFEQPQKLFTYIVLIPMHNQKFFIYYSLIWGSNILIAPRSFSYVDPIFLKPHVHANCPISLCKDSMEPSCYSMHLQHLTWIYNHKSDLILCSQTNDKNPINNLNSYISFLRSIFMYLMGHHTHWSHFNSCNLNSWNAMWKG